jgi:hypothetical protein
MDRGKIAVELVACAGMNPNKLGKLANHRQERCKLPLPDFIALIYIKRFGKMPDVVKMVEEVAAAEMAKREARRLRKRAATGDQSSS